MLARVIGIGVETADMLVQERRGWGQKAMYN